MITTPEPGIWTQNPDHPTDQWDILISGHRYADDQVFGHITQYEGSNSYCWQAVRGDHRIAGIADGRVAAQAMAEETLALPVDVFNARVAAEYMDYLRRLEQRIMALAPATNLLPGYHAGYEAGVAEMKSRLTALLELA